MTFKRMIPILVVLTLVLGGIAACQASSIEETVKATAEKIAIQIEEAPHLEETAPEEVEKVEPQENSAPARTADADDDAAEAVEPEPAEAKLPEFVPPKPAVLDIEPEALAFAMGNPDAPVQIIEFTDYQCPFCARHAVQTMPDLIENLVESDRVFYGIKDLPLDTLHPQARTASVAARCAGEQDAYLQMHDVIFMTQTDWSDAGEDANAFFVEVAEGLDLDSDTFESCLADGNQAENVQANLQEAQSLNVSSTPFFFIDGYAISGAQPFELFEAAVELAEAGELDAVMEVQARQAYEAMLDQVAAQQAPPQPVEPVEVSMDNAFAIGDPDAPVTIVEYTDYQCPFCARHALQTFNRIEEEFVDSGQVRYVFKDMPLTQIHPQATLVAEAARCAGTQDQEAFVTMHDLLFENQRAWSGNGAAADLFAEYAAEIGIDGDGFAACLENHETEAAVQADMAEAMSLGISGTPAFIINGQQVFGAQPFELFARAVETLIAGAPVQPASN